MAIIKVTCAELPLWGQLEDGAKKWGNNVFVFNNPNVKECDYWFIADTYGLFDDNEAFCPKEHVYLMMCETEAICTYENSYVKQFKNIISVQNKDYNVENTIRWYLAPWFVGFKFGENGVDMKHHKTYMELQRIEAIEKKKLISVVSSNKTMCEGHRKRLEFVERLKDEFGNQIDIFGRGINSFEDKWDVLADYKYHIAIENAAVDDYITEKFLDPVLALSYPIYYGAPNIGKYYNGNSFTSIDIYNPGQAVRIIKQILETDNFYEEHLSGLMNARRLILNDYNMFNKISEFVQQNKGEFEPVRVKIHKGYRGMVGDFVRRCFRWIN